MWKYVKICDLTLKVKVSKIRRDTFVRTRRFHHPRPGRQVCSARSGRASRDALHEPRVTPVTSGDQEKLRVPGYQVRVVEKRLCNHCVIWKFACLSSSHIVIHNLAPSHIISHHLTWSLIKPSHSSAYFNHIIILTNSDMDGIRTESTCKVFWNQALCDSLCEVVHNPSPKAWFVLVLQLTSRKHSLAPKQIKSVQGFRNHALSAIWACSNPQYFWTLYSHIS